MVRRFSPASADKLATCDPRLVKVLNAALQVRDLTILEGRRTHERQEQLYFEGKSKLRGDDPRAKHCRIPSAAVDVAPWFPDPPHVRWDNRDAFVQLSGVILSIAHSYGYGIRWGGDWDVELDNGLNRPGSFDDLVHYEVI